ncbi:MAG: DUF2834 domain-containing protein [Ardenticatenaceae bacterium]|nr:DUF2834 domain-containing protein [Ardenticatenaceae bacterium]
MKKVYASLSILGFAIPYAFFVPFLLENGLDIPLFVQQLFATRIAAFFSADVLVSSVALWAFIYYELQKHKIANWGWAIAANLTVGVSLALPLFLLLREQARELDA